MATRSVGEAFRELLDRIEPSSSEVSALRAHKTTIRQAVGSEFPGFNRVEDFGSHIRSTAIRRWSDIDYLAVLGKSDVTYAGSRVRSTTTLDRLKRALQKRFPRSAIRIQSPAVIVEFSDGGVDVVPSVWVGTVSDRDGYPIFDIPDTDGGWMRSSPQRHAKYISEKNQGSGYKLGGAVRLLKKWKFSRAPSIPFLGFHVELLLASSGTCTGAKAYQNIMFDAFASLRDRRGAALNDPVGISPRIPLAHTATQRDSVVNSARYAAEHASSAISAEVDGDDVEAFRQWDLVFNGEFPARRY